VEREQDYIDAATARIEAIERGSGVSLEMQKGKRAEKRIPFGTLLESGLLEPGTELSCAKGKHLAIVRADGSLKSGDHTGSIHKVGALVQGQEACNGWTFWHVKKGRARSPIDELRKQIRSRLQA
jgi:modification methylase